MRKCDRCLDKEVALTTNWCWDCWVAIAHARQRFNKLIAQKRKERLATEAIALTNVIEF